MKKMIYVGLMVMVMVSMMVFGFGISAAGENGVSDNMIASVAQDRPAAEQTSVETEGVLMAEVECNASYDYNTCTMLRDLCTLSSPFMPGGTFCSTNWNKTMCGDCYP